MNHKDVLKSAWDTTLRYPALLIFGLILALTAGGGGGGRGGAQYTMPGRDLFGAWGFRPVESHPELVGPIVALAGSACCLGAVLIVATIVARYVSDTALVRLVNGREETGETRGVKSGFRSGWSRTALRFLGIDLLTGIPMFVFSVLLLTLSGAPLLLWLVDSTAARAVGTVAAIGLFFLVLFLLILIGAALSVLVDLARRACAIEELGVLDSISRGYRVLRANLKDAALMWLIMLALGLVWMIALGIATGLLVLVASVFGGVPGLVAGSLLALATDGATPWIIGSLVAAPAFIIVVGLPLMVLAGFAEVFKSTVWTLTYRELRALEGVRPA